MSRNRRYTGRKNYIGVVIAILVLVLSFCLFSAYSYTTNEEFRSAVDELFDVVNVLREDEPIDPDTVIPTPTPEPQPEPDPEPEPIPEVELEYEGTAIYIPLETLQGENAIENCVTMVKSANANGVVIDIKTAHGKIWSSLPTDDEWLTRLTDENAYDLAALSARLKAEDIYIIGRVSAFKDHEAGRIFRDGFVKVNGNIAFIDGTNMLNLDPYTETAQDYIIDIATAAAIIGVDEILIADAVFPSVGRLELVAYNDNGLTKPQALSQFFERLEAELEELETKLTVELPPRALYDEIYAVNSGQNFDFSTFPCDIAMSVSMSELPYEFVLNGETYVNDASIESIGDITYALINEGAMASLEVSPIIKMTYPATQDSINTQKNAASSNKIILWNEEGLYNNSAE